MRVALLLTPRSKIYQLLLLLRFQPDKGICRNKLEASFICFFVQDDEDLDLFNDETEEEKAAAEENEAAKKAAAGAKKKECE